MNIHLVFDPRIMSLVIVISKALGSYTRNQGPQIEPKSLQPSGFNDMRLRGFGV